MKTEKKRSSYLRDTVERFLRHKLAVAGLAVVVVEVLLLLLLPVFMDLQPTTITDVFYGEPSAEHILGTDGTGRDAFARLIYGGRTSLSIGFLAVVVQACIGIPLGIIAGYYRGAAETIIMRAADMFQSIPSMCLNIVVIGVMGWTNFARLLYAKVISIREKEYVESARAIGESNFTIMTKYILSNALSPALVAFTFGIPSAILAESALSFLGLGIQIPQASWAVIANKPWLWIPAGLCIFITLLSINLLGDGLRDALDPKTKVG